MNNLLFGLSAPDEIAQDFTTSCFKRIPLIPYLGTNGIIQVDFKYKAATPLI
jgi:hypothetical protein